MNPYGVLCIFLVLLITACAKPPDYYTNPNKGGYLQQTAHGICEKCNTHFKASAYQTDHYGKLSCPKCGHKQHMNQASQRYAGYKVEQERQQAIRNEQAMANFVGAVLVGVASGYAEASKIRYNYAVSQSNHSIYTSAYPNYSSPALSLNDDVGCLSSTECGIGKKCVTPSWSTKGVCMNTVDENGNRTYDLPDLMNTKGNCKFNSDCPAGFTCDSRSQECIKR